MALTATVIAVGSLLTAPAIASATSASVNGPAASTAAQYKCGLDKFHQTYRNCTGHNEHLTVAYFEALTKENKFMNLCKKPGTATSWQIVGQTAAMYAAHAWGRCSPGQV